ncbi:MAG TPA: hypothetical protein VFA10_08130 [Ktedonobacteraceae bacterium]|jgi:hypothetical protein|nr:hypothetical protein [Ktedonobacteraceae bacterium]
MDENTSNTNQTSTTQSRTVIASQDGSAAVKIESPAGSTEHRQAYGTAKTENLRDSGAWRFVLPAFVVLLCLALLAIPLLILGPLLYGSLAPQQHVQLTWVWIVMILLEVGTAAVIIWGLVKIFMTQAGNYSE